MDMDTFDQTHYCVEKIREKNVHKFDEKPTNGSLNAVPSTLKFTFDSGNFKIQEKKVEITNYFLKPCPIRFLPLETDYFKFKNVYQRTWLNPGSVFKLKILFIPDEDRDYNDILKICYFNDRTMQIKIHAETTIKFSFPAVVNFGNVPLGRTVSYKIPIHSHAEKDFSFAIVLLNGGSCVDVYPRRGHVKLKQKPVTIVVIYRPLRYISMNFQIRIFISDLCKAAHVVNFCAYTRPGLLREIRENVEIRAKSKMQRRKIGTTFCKEVKPISAKEDINKSKYCLRESTAKCTSFEKLLLKQCSHFPLYTPHAVNCILNLKIRRSISEHELKGPSGIFLLQTMKQKTEKLKEFLAKVEAHYRKNEQTKFHHKPKVNYGTFDASENQMIEIQTQREQAWDNYRDFGITTTSEKYILEREKPKKIRQRILRISQKYPNTTSTSFRKEASFFHYCKILPFLQTARKIVLRNRLLNVLSKLQGLTPESISQFEEPFIGNYSLASQT